MSERFRLGVAFSGRYAARHGAGRAEPLAAWHLRGARLLAGGHRRHRYGASRDSDHRPHPAGGVPVLQVVTAIAITFTLTVGWAIDNLAVRIGLVLLALGISTYILRLPTKRLETV